MPRPTPPPRPRRLGLGLGVLLALTGGLAAGLDPAVADAGGPGQMAAASSRGQRDLLEVALPPLAPVRVPVDGTFEVPVDNLGGLPLDVEVAVSLGGAPAGAGRATLAPQTHGSVRVSLDRAGMDALVAATWPYASVRLTSTAVPGGTALTRRVRLVAPSYAPRTAANPTNPLAGVAWADYQGPLEPVSAAYDAADVDLQGRLAPVALTPKARWFTPHVPPARLGRTVRDYIAAAQQETPGGLVQLTMFVLSPWEDDAVQHLPTAAQVAEDKAYIDAFVDAVGSTRALVVVQPDGPFAGEAPHHDPTLADLVGLAVRKLAALPQTAAYIDMGSADWHRGDISEELPLLLREGIGRARGFAMDVTHADATGDEVDHAHALVTALARRGVPGVHAVIDTSDNGRPFGGADWQAQHPHGPSISTAPACHRQAQRLCLVLGVPPTTDVANPRWGLSRAQRRTAAREVDGYLWVKRPWLDPFHGYRFVAQRALDVVRFSPYRSPEDR